MLGQTAQGGFDTQDMMWANETQGETAYNTLISWLMEEPLPDLSHDLDSSFLSDPWVR